MENRWDDVYKSVGAQRRRMQLVKDPRESCLTVCQGGEEVSPQFKSDNLVNRQQLVDALRGQDKEEEPQKAAQG